MSGQRNTNRYSVTALYSMVAEQDVDVEDDLARGESGMLELQELPSRQIAHTSAPLPDPPTFLSAKAAARAQGKDIGPVKEELCLGTGREVS